MESVPHSANGKQPRSERVRAVQYVRMSTDHQKYSTANQEEANRTYASNRGLEIVRTYVDDGRSGLSLQGRPALRQLLEDVLKGDADFRAILVYDISRWGRFQDADEAAHYEFICKRAGVAVHYCAEPFDNDGSPLATIYKGLKRAAAGDYSRDLSVKVHVGQSRLARLGFRLGGYAGYGLRRLLVAQDGTTRCKLETGEWKGIASDRIVLAPGPLEEIETVRSIFSMFVRERRNERQITDALNARGLDNGLGRKWDHNVIGRMLRNEKYVGNLIWNRSSFKLQQVHVKNDPELWIRVDGAIEPIIDQPLFDAAQAIFKSRGRFSSAGRPRDLTNDEMLTALKDLWRKHGYLIRALVDRTVTLPSSTIYDRRFGSLKRALQIVGYKHARPRGSTLNGRPRGLSKEEMLEGLRLLWKRHGHLSETIIGMDKSVPGITAYFYRFGSLLRAYELIGFVPERCRTPGRQFVRNSNNRAILGALRDLLRERGRLSKSIIDQCESVPSHGTIGNRFGGLMAAYRLIGYKPNPYGYGRRRNLSNQEMLEALRELLRKQGYLSQALIRKTRAVPSIYAYYKRFGGLLPAYKMIGYGH